MNPTLKAAKAAMIAKLVAVTIPNTSPRGTPDEINGLGDLLEGVIDAVDPFVEAVGKEFASVAPAGYGKGKRAADFKNILREALEGWGLYEIRDAAQTAEAEFEEA